MAMRAMVLERPRTPLVMREWPVPRPAAGEILIEVAACGVCRTDLHVVDGELPNPKLPIIPGHEVAADSAAFSYRLDRYEAVPLGGPVQHLFVELPKEGTGMMKDIGTVPAHFAFFLREH